MTLQVKVKSETVAMEITVVGATETETVKRAMIRRSVTGALADLNKTTLIVEATVEVIAMVATEIAAKVTDSVIDLVAAAVVLRTEIAVIMTREIGTVVVMTTLNEVEAETKTLDLDSETAPIATSRLVSETVRGIGTQEVETVAVETGTLVAATQEAGTAVAGTVVAITSAIGLVTAATDSETVTDTAMTIDTETVTRRETGSMMAATGRRIPETNGVVMELTGHEMAVRDGGMEVNDREMVARVGGMEVNDPGMLGNDPGMEVNDPEMLANVLVMLVKDREMEAKGLRMEVKGHEMMIDHHVMLTGHHAMLTRVIRLTPTLLHAGNLTDADRLREAEIRHMMIPDTIIPIVRVNRIDRKSDHG